MSKADYPDQVHAGKMKAASKAKSPRSKAMKIVKAMKMTKGVRKPSKRM